MRYYRATKVPTIGEQAFIVSDYSGPVEFDTFYGTDNLLTNKGKLFKYKVAKPYTSIVIPSVTPAEQRVVLEDQSVINITPPSPELIIAALQEDLWVQRFDSIFSEIDRFASNGAVEKALRYGDILLYVTASEARQTLLMVKNIFRTLFNAILQLYKKARKLDIIATMETMSKLWLEYRYGWRPFIAEVEALRKALTHIRLDGVKSAYGVSKNDNLNRTPIDLGFVEVRSGSLLFTYKGTITPDSGVSKVGFNYLNTDSSRNDDWLAILGLDIESLLSTAWELVPFSFVVDMFTNVGSLLQVQNSSDQVDSFNHYKTHQLKGTLDLECISVALNEPGKPIDINAMLARHNIPLISGVSDRVLEDVMCDVKANGHRLMRNAWVQGHTGVPWVDLPFIPISAVTRIGPVYAYPNTNSTYRHLSVEELVNECVDYYSQNDWSSSNNFVISGRTSPTTFSSISIAVFKEIFVNVLKYIDCSQVSKDTLKAFFVDCIYLDNGEFLAKGSLLAEQNRVFYRYSENGYNAFFDRFEDSGQVYYIPDVFLFGFKPAKIEDYSGDFSPLNYSLRSTVTTRRKDGQASHSMTLDWDLSTAQYADLGALATVLTSRFRK